MNPHSSSHQPTADEGLQQELLLLQNQIQLMEQSYSQLNNDHASLTQQNQNLAQQNHTLTEQAQNLMHLATDNEDLRQQNQLLVSQLQADPTNVERVVANVGDTVKPIAREPKIQGPQPFTNRKDNAVEFLLKCEGVFLLQPRTYPTDIIKIRYAINLLKGEAYNWAIPQLLLPSAKQEDWIKKWDLFKKEFEHSFGETDLVAQAHYKIKQLKQTGSAISYITEFRRWAAYLDYGDQALVNMLFDGLKDTIKDRILSPHQYKKVNDLCAEIIRWDNLLFQRLRGKLPGFTSYQNTRSSYSAAKPFHRSNSAAPQRYTPARHEPMEIDAAKAVPRKLSSQEREHRIKNKLCLYCGEPGHFAPDCPKKKNMKPRFKVNAIEDVPRSTDSVNTIQLKDRSQA